MVNNITSQSTSVKSLDSHQILEPVTEWVLVQVFITQHRGLDSAILYHR
jgi:hypothetical protein